MHMPVRNTDPHTSYEAAVHMQDKRAAQQAIAAKAVEQYPGSTSMELSRRAHIDRYMLARRLSECEAAGMVRRGQAKRCSVSGRNALTWYPPGAVEQMTLNMERVA